MYFCICRLFVKGLRISAFSILQAGGLRVAALPIPYGRGVIATAPIPAKTQILSVPLNATFSLIDADKVVSPGAFV